MDEEIEYEGKWWLPEKPEEQISGTLKFTVHGGGILKLTDSFKNVNKNINPEIILGTVHYNRKIYHGENVTLHKCSKAGFDLTSFYVEFILTGAHFLKIDDLKFTNLSIIYFNLDEWVNISGFDSQNIDGYKEIIIKYKRPEEISIWINNFEGDSFSLSIDFLIGLKNLKHDFIAQKEASIEQQACIRIMPGEGKTLDEYLQIMFQIQNFLSMGITEPIYPLEVYGVIDSNIRVKDAKNSVGVEICYKIPYYNPKKYKPVLPFFMLFTFRDISDNLSLYLNNWFSKANLLAPVYSLYFGSLYNPSIYVEHKFLSLIQAIESYHDRIYVGEYIEKETYKKEIYDPLIKEIPTWVKGDFRKDLSKKLEFGYEFSLRQRLKEILENYNEIISSFIKNENKFIRSVVDTRNYLTHYDESLKKRAASGTDLLLLTLNLRILIEICLLYEIGFDLKLINKFIFRIYEFRKYNWIK